MPKALAQAVAEVLPPEKLNEAKPSLITLRNRLGIRRKTLEALEWVVDHNTSYADAGVKFGVSAENLSDAMDRSGVREYLEARCEQRLTVLRSRAVTKIGGLMESRSDYVALEAARTVLSETKKTEAGVAGNVSIEIVL